MVNNARMTINPLISAKIQNDEIPSKIKQILNEILNMEIDMDKQNAQKDFKSNIGKILEKYADDEEVCKFCEQND